MTSGWTVWILYILSVQTRLGLGFHNSKSGLLRLPLLPPMLSTSGTLASGGSERIKDNFCYICWLKQRGENGGRREERKERQCQKMKTHFSSSIKARCILGPVSRQLHNDNILKSFFFKDAQLSESVKVRR